VPVGVGCSDAIEGEFERPSVTEETFGVEGVLLTTDLDGLKTARSCMRGGVVVDSAGASSLPWFVLPGPFIFSELAERLYRAGRTEFALRIGDGDAAPLV
jgi:hypothetical protein